MKKKANRSDCGHLVGLGLVEQSQSIALDSAFLLRDAVQDLNRIALVDTDNYNEMLLSPSSAKCSATDGLIEAQEKLAATEEAMLHDPQQVETGHALGGLARAIYGFHSYIHALKDVSDEHASEHRRQASEILKLQRKVEELQTQNSKIRKYVRQVVNDNITLTDKLNQASRDKKKLFRHAKHLTTEIHNAKKYNEELQVLAHEHILIMASCSRERKETSETEVSTVCNDDGTESIREVHGDFSSIYTTFHPPPRILMIPANETAPMFVQDESSVNALQSPSICESYSNDMSQSPIFANLPEVAVGLQTNSQNGLLSEAGCEFKDGSEISTAEHPLIENMSETASRHPKTLLQSLGFSRKLPAESGVSRNSSIFREKSRRTNKATSSRIDGGFATVLVRSASSYSFDAPKKTASLDEQINASMHSNDSASREAEIPESSYGFGSERGGNQPKAIFPFWNRGQHNVA